MLLAAGLALPGSPAQPAPDAGAIYTFGVFPYLSVSTLEGVFAPLAAEMAASLGRPVRFASTSSYEAFAQKLRDGEYDIAYVQPFDYVNVATPSGYLPVAKGYDRIRAVFFVSSGSPLRGAGDLRGKTVGLPSRLAAVSYLARMALTEADLTPGRDVRLTYFSSHQSCLQQVLIGNVDACASAPDIVRMFESEMKVSLRGLLESRSIPGTVFVVHPRVPAPDRERIERALVSTTLAGVAPELRRLFLEGDRKDGRYFYPVDDSEYDLVRRYATALGAAP